MRFGEVHAAQKMLPKACATYGGDQIRSEEGNLFVLLRRGYPEPFCDEVSKNLNTDWTAQRLIGYLSHYQKLKMEDVADEVLAILSDRNRIMQKKRMEEANARWNQFLYESFENEEEESYHG